MATPQITLTADLDSTLAGDAGLAGYLEITLCGFGPVLPHIPGECMLADAGIPQLVGPQVGDVKLSVLLWGNDVIVPGPDTTFYCIKILDADKNVVQAGNYRFDGTEIVDLSTAAQILPPYGYLPELLQVLPCAGAVPGSNYTAPGTPLIAVFYNGVQLRAGMAFPLLSFTAVGAAIALNFVTEVGDRIDALCVA